MILLAASAALGGPWVVTGLDSTARHTHGGPPALLSSARFQVEHAEDAPVELRVKGVEYLRGHSCDTPPTEVVATPAVTDLRAADGAPVEALAPGTSQVTVNFEPVEAYLSHCGRFAFRVTFVAGEQALVAVAETRVMRMSPR